jgi:hypothetical protein
LKGFLDLSMTCLKEAIAARFNDFEHARKDSDLAPRGTSHTNAYEASCFSLVGQDLSWQFTASPGNSRCQDRSWPTLAGSRQNVGDNFSSNIG